MPTPIVRNKLEHFDRWSLTYEDSWLQRYLFDRVHRAVLTLVEHRVEPHAILDVGCGTGRLLRAARAKWPDARLVGIDPSRGMIDVAHRLTPSAAFHLGSAEEIPLPDASVDLALSTMSFHHWRDQVAGLHEVVRVLGHGGYFYLEHRA